MSTVDTDITAHRATSPTPFARVWRVTRLLTTNPATTIGWPLVIMAGIFALTWSIWWLLMANLDGEQSANAAEGIQYNGAASYIFVYMLVVAVQAVNLSFPLALGYGATRRAFTLGSGLAFLLLSAVYALVMTLGAWLERLTEGWGVHGSFFLTFFFATDAGWIAQWWVYFCWFVFFFFTGMAFAAVFVRWKAPGLIMAFGIIVLIVLGIIAAFTFGGGWAAFVETLSDWGTLGVASAMLVPATLTAAIGHLVLRRATPRG